MSKKRDSKPPDMELVAAAYRARMAEADLAASYYRMEKLEARVAELEAQVVDDDGVAWRDKWQIAVTALELRNAELERLRERALEEEEGEKNG